MIHQENKQHNLLHYEGEQYILAAAFHTILEGFSTSPVLYVGLDSRKEIHPKDTLVEVFKSEMNKASYARVPISTGGGFTPSWEKPFLTEDEKKESKQPDPVFVLNAAATFTAKGEDMGLARNLFLTNTAEGKNGLLIVSAPLKKPFDFDEGYKLTVFVSVSLREADLKNTIKS